MRRTILVIIAVLLVSFFVAKSLTKVPYNLYMRGSNGKYYVFMTTGRLNFWYEICRRTDLALSHLTGTLGVKERGAK
jgi:hypothetical protein